MPKHTVLIEMWDETSPEGMVGRVWKVVDVDHPPVTNGPCVAAGHGIPRGARFAQVDLPARKGEPLRGLVYAPAEHIRDHALGEGHGWSTSEQEAMLAFA